MEHREKGSVFGGALFAFHGNKILIKDIRSCDEQGILFRPEE